MGRGPGHVPYVELHAHSAFSFLDGANQPEELVAEAVRLGLDGLAITDHDGLHGVVRFSQAARHGRLPTVIGSELSLSATTATTGVPDPQANHLVVLARDAEGYSRLSRAVATAHLVTGRKGERDYGRAVGLDPLEVLAEQAGGPTAATGSSSRAAARGRCVAPSTPTARGSGGTSRRPAPSSIGSRRCSAGRTSPSSSPTTPAPPTVSATPSWSTSPGRRG
ncbi:PHP domain-containing protein [Serinibacter arcticus]|uniref:PHP domain-containing protein n=1 Tax=Serinibacter arcticus TaxID=1655435 RepID=UPI001304F84A